MKLQLYPWQKECLNIWSQNNYHGIINVVTGAGKTVLALSAIERLRQNLTVPLKVKIVVPTTFLLSQWRNSILEFSDSPTVSREEIGYCYGSHKDTNDRSYMIYVINSARFTLARHILNDLKNGYAILLIADECHHYTSEENRKIFDFLPYLKQNPGDYYCLGLSATPYCSNYESVLVPALGGEIYRYGFSEAAAENTITPFAVFQTSLSLQVDERLDYEDLSQKITMTLNRLTVICPSIKGLNRNQFFGRLNRLSRSGDAVTSVLANQLLILSYQRKSLICCAKARLSCTCSLIRELPSQAKIIIFGERIDQANKLFELLTREFPGQAGRCHSKMDKQVRRQALERFRNGELRILVSCRALDEGFDVPDADVGIVLSCASIERQRIQRLGRILRRREGKHISSLYYLYLEHTVEDPSFFSEMPEQSISCHLLYCDKTEAFSFPEYEQAAIQVLERFGQVSSDEAVQKEARKCILAGMIRSDWMLGRILGEHIWEKKIDGSKTTEEKNYWICMRLIGKAIDLET